MSKIIIFDKRIVQGLSCWSKIINNYQKNIVTFHKDFVASTQSDFFQGQNDSGLIYWSKQGILKGEVLLYR